jgi:hypothetical protein
MAGAGKKTFTAGEVLTASDVNTYLMEQSVMNFAGTAARASAIPTPSTGMTSYIGTTGTASIPQIETYTGSQWQTPYGLTQVANVSFASAASVNVDNVFTTAYDNYKIIVRVTAASATADLWYYGRKAGTTYTGTTISQQIWNNTASTLATNQTTTGRIGTFSSSNTSFTQVEMTIMSPKLAARTSYNAMGLFIDNSNNFFARYFQGTDFSTNDYDGFQLIPESGTFTGTIKIYGLRNS